ncbi:unnamed protein product [Caenorhabditis sp. 36 PRJEB53466]|nr:unnamed protein product [Caenorhabditis sp. 36 PRJEB53466]
MDSIREYYATNYTRCPADDSFLASWQGLATCCHLIGGVSLPIQLLTYYVILKKTPKNMKTIKVQLLLFHFFLYALAFSATMSNDEINEKTIASLAKRLRKPFSRREGLRIVKSLLETDFSVDVMFKYNVDKLIEEHFEISDPFVGALLAKIHDLIEEDGYRKEEYSENYSFISRQDSVDEKSVQRGSPEYSPIAKQNDDFSSMESSPGRFQGPRRNLKLQMQQGASPF